MKKPFIKLSSWIQEENLAGISFSKGAVLSTVSKNGVPRSRVVGTMIDDEIIKFHTSPVSRKVKDIEFNSTVSLTYSFQRSLRSVSIEGILVSLCEKELEQDWMSFDSDFRKQYLVFGGGSGNEIKEPELLKLKLAKILNGEENSRPESFIGYKLSEITRISFYAVNNNDFASSQLFERNSSDVKWTEKTVIP